MPSLASSEQTLKSNDAPSPTELKTEQYNNKIKKYNVPEQYVQTPHPSKKTGNCPYITTNLSHEIAVTDPLNTEALSNYIAIQYMGQSIQEGIM